MTMPGLAANRRPRVVAPRSPRITYSGFYKGGRVARSDSKAADWNYGHWMFDLAVRDPGCRSPKKIGSKKYPLFLPIGMKIAFLDKLAIFR